MGPRNSGSHRTPRWREQDSNHRSRVTRPIFNVAPGWFPPTEKSERKRTDTRSVGPFPRGTDGSNPVPFIVPPRAQAFKALRNTSDAKAARRQAPLAFRSLDPFRALREPDRRRRDEERPFPLRTKNYEQNPKTTA